MPACADTIKIEEKVKTLKRIRIVLFLLVSHKDHFTEVTARIAAEVHVTDPILIELDSDLFDGITRTQHPLFRLDARLMK